MVEPFMSVIVTIVLLNEATTWAMPLWTFLLPLALMILIGSTTALGSSERFSSFFGSAGAAVAAPAASFLAPFGALALAAFGAASAAFGAASAVSVLAAFGAASVSALGASVFL